MIIDNVHCSSIMWKWRGYGNIIDSVSEWGKVH